MKIKHRLILIVFALALMIASTSYIYALLTDTVYKGPIEYQLGDLRFDVVGEIKSSYLYPGENLVTEAFIINNHSTIDIELRIILEFYLIDLNEAVNISEYTEIFDFNSDEKWLKNGDYYYYQEDVTPLDEEIFLFGNLTLDGHIVRNTFNSENFKIKLIIQAKQKDFVDWVSLGDQFIH